MVAVSIPADGDSLEHPKGVPWDADRRHRGKSTSIRGCSYVAIFCVHTLVNKYILTDLNFTFPTVYQGWQNLVKFLVLLILSIYCHKLPLQSLRSVLAEWRCYVLIPVYSATVYCGSVALSQLPIASFMAISSVPSAAAVWLLGLSEHKLAKPEAFLTTLLLCIAVSLVSLSDESRTDNAYLWGLLYCGSSVFQEMVEIFLFNEDSNISPLSRIYVCSLGSSILFMPATYVLGEAIEAYHNFPFFRVISFNIGCLIAGISGACLALLERDYLAGANLPVYQGAAKLSSVLVAIPVFRRIVSVLHVLWCLLSVGLALLTWYCQSVSV